MAGRILVMDDEESIRLLLKDLLEDEGWAVETAAEGAAAVELYRARKGSPEAFDLVVLDLSVRCGLGGAATLDALRTLDPGVKAVVASAHSDDPLVVDYRDAGFCGVLPKPFRIAQLTALLEEHGP